jgi:hypothetical protein
MNKDIDRNELPLHGRREMDGGGKPEALVVDRVGQTP